MIVRSKIIATLGNYGKNKQTKVGNNSEAPEVILFWREWNVACAALSTECFMVMYFHSSLEHQEQA